MIVFLDSGIIGLLSSPNDRELAIKCQYWLYRLLARSVYVVSSDICDYEVKRGFELALHKNPHVSGLSRLDGLAQIVDFLPTERVSIPLPLTFPHTPKYLPFHRKDIRPQLPVFYRRR